MFEEITHADTAVPDLLMDIRGSFGTGINYPFEAGKEAYSENCSNKERVCGILSLSIWWHFLPR